MCVCDVCMWEREREWDQLTEKYEQYKQLENNLEEMQIIEQYEDDLP